ncbi:MFS transporter [Kutzneria chonburiensis]|uniref:MFS transporter n=1 Tax=Kutzneria chonburiensis TaxID=1483604 RepID=A0ABV6MKA7_9PSEU|nr:MFS transporter [Kutzneria chonburiensis]
MHGIFVVQLDVALINVALEAIRRSIGGGLGWEQRMAAGYTIVLAAGMLTAGSLGDRYGLRRIYMLGAVLFGVGPHCARWRRPRPSRSSRAVEASAPPR